MKRLLLILSLICFAISTWAGQITRNQALLKAQQFLSQKGLPSSLTSAETHASRHRAQGAMQPDYYYVFNAGPDQGFVIVSGDDRTETVLGYATSGNFDVDNIPPAMADLLNYYAAQIEAIRNGAPVAVRRASHKYLPDLMTVKWNQNEPYNNKTPLGYYSNVNEGVNCVTGCVATAMAQVLYHQHFVDATQATIPGYKNYYYWQPPSGKKTAYLADIPSGSALEWDKMVDNYETQTTTQEQKDAVANLMLYCGTAVNMKYNIRGSSAPVSAIPDAFKSYFGYSRGTRYVSRSVYSDSEWDDLIYNEIYLGRPVIYGGQTANDEGHAFIVHGYDGGGRYSINWGWGGFQDNYFYLSDLTPPQQGTGSGSGGFNYSQEAVINLAKEDGSFSETVKATVMDTKIGTFQRYTDGSLVVPTQTEYAADKDPWGRVKFSLAISYTSRLVNTYIMDFGYGILNSNSELVGDVEKLNTDEIKDGVLLTYGTGTSGFGGNLSTGQYYIKAYSKESTSSDWLLCDDADKYAVSLTVTDTNMSFKVVDISTFIPEPEPEVSDADRSELTSTYTSLKSSVEAKQVAVAENEATIIALKTAINEKKQSIATIETSIASINTKLTNDSYLSESQKNDFLTQLITLNNQLVQLQNDLSALESTLTTLESTNASLKTQLNELLSQISEQLGSIAGITTKEALNASKVLAAQLTTTGNGYDVNGVTTQISGVETSLNGITFTNMQTSLSDLDKSIDKAIADAESAALEEQERKELEAAKACMKETVEVISKSALDKVAAVETNTKTIADLKAAINTASESAKTVADKITAIKSKLGNTLLTDVQKSEYLSKLDVLEDELKAYEASLSELTAQLSEAELSNALLKTKLDEANNLITELSASIDAATKKSEMEALNTNADAIKSLVDGVDVASLTTNLGTIETKQKSLSTESIITALSDFDKSVDKAIADAESAALEEQERKKLEENKKALEESYDKLKADLAAKQQLLTENENTIASLESDIKKAKDAIDPIEKKIAEIKESLNNDILSADKKASFQRELDAFDKVKSTYADDLNTLEAKLATAKKSNEELKANLEKIAKLIDSQIEAIKNISTDDELSKAKTDKQDAESQLGKVDPNAVRNVLHSLKTEFEALDFDGIAMALESLESVIQQVIAQAIAIDEYEKQQAEKLAKAKEDCQSALDKLGNTIETHQSYFDQLKEAHETVKAKMKELDDVLAQLKIQYADIEEMLNDLIAKQTSNQYADKIGKLQDSLMNLADNIAKLENQRQIISGQIEQLEDPMLRYDLQIQKAIDISNQLPVLLASATDIADVETMTELATNESNALSSNGVDDYNQFVDYYSMVVNNLNIYINNVIIVGNQAESLENDVNETITGIGNVIVDDSEILGRYDMKGNRVDSTYKGVQIIRLKNGKSIKINVK